MAIYIQQRSISCHLFSYSNIKMEMLFHLTFKNSTKVILFFVFLLHMYGPRNVITLGKTISDHNKQMITDGDICIAYCNNVEWSLENLYSFYHVNWRIALTTIIVSSLHSMSVREKAVWFNFKTLECIKQKWSILSIMEKVI